MLVIDNLINPTNCCGLRELNGIDGHRVEDVVYTVGHAIENELPRHIGAFYVFTGIQGQTVDFLKIWIDHNPIYGSCVGTRYLQNPNSGNMLKVCVWETDENARRELARFYRDSNVPPVDLAPYGLVVGDYISYDYERGRIRGVNTSGVELEMRNGELLSVPSQSINRIIKARAYNS
jgi:hypothetical protein